MIFAAKQLAYRRIFHDT